MRRRRGRVSGRPLFFSLLRRCAPKLAFCRGMGRAFGVLEGDATAILLFCVVLRRLSGARGKGLRKAFFQWCLVYFGFDVFSLRATSKRNDAFSLFYLGRCSGGTLRRACVTSAAVGIPFDHS